MKSRFILLIGFSYILISSLLTTSCKKSITEEVHIDTTITGNTAPNYTGVPTLSINLYVNKLYVDVLGLQPTSVEKSTDVNYLITNNLSDSARTYIINQLLSDTSFYSRLFEITSSAFLNGTGYSDIKGQLNQFASIRQLDSANGNATNVIYDNFEIGRLNNLNSAASMLETGQISFNEYYRRFIDNYFYDQINMGTENFCKAVFQNLFDRPPTASELSASESMVNGSSSAVFLVDGSDKDAFEQIVTTCNEFYEGYTINVYLQYLLRQPSSEESADGTTMLKPSGDYKKLHLQILKSKEYAGF